MGVAPADDLAAAWNAVHDAEPDGWFVGRPSYRNDLKTWEMYAFDPRRAGRRRPRPARDWTAVAPSELEVVHEMARCLDVIRTGGWPA